MAAGIARTSPQQASNAQAPTKLAQRRPSELPKSPSSKAPRVGHKKSRKGCSQCKRRHVKCNEEQPCSNCVRHGVACSLAGGPFVPREDAKNRRTSTTSSNASLSKATSQETSLSSTTASVTGSRGVSPRPSPFQALTGLIDRPPPGQDKNWTLDLELMHHYMANVHLVLTEDYGVDFVLNIWRVEMPKIAFASEYVMHGLLGFSALHKAYMEPENAQRLRESAVDHLDKALVLYRSEPAPATAQTADSKFVFTWMVALFAYAIPPSLPAIDAMVEMFNLIKGTDAILSETWFWVSQGPFAPILSRGCQDAMPMMNYTLPEGMDFGLNHLDYMIGVEPMIPDDRRTCALVLTELKAIYNTVLPTQASCSLGSIISFPKADSGNFAQLVKRRLPQALIILAYYTVLLDILDNRWWIRGWSKRVLQDVLGSMDEQWRHWIEWPVQTVLLKEPAPSASVDFMV